MLFRRLIRPWSISRIPVGKTFTHHHHHNYQIPGNLSFRSARRHFGTGGLSAAPRGIFFRVFWTGTTATAGYIYYKINEAGDWLSKQTSTLQGLLAEGAIGIIDAFALVTDTLEEIRESVPSFTFGRRSRSSGKTEAGEEGSSSSSLSSEDGGVGGDANRPSESLLANSGDFHDFIKRMLEIRSILRAANLGDSFDLPSIVVLGSQSSGKSSVLETIVGHDFLPKGPNMVTRRPLELTLVHTPTATRDYAVFDRNTSAGATGKAIYDFTQVRRTLEELNLAVPEGEWISDRPISLTIHSRHVPDLSLVDLPGYIQLSSRTQPPALREAIRAVCERYIRAPNIILAVCPADVDLANSEALQASRRVDPRGERTIGVITKMDLVDPASLQETLAHDQYPLAMGYIGMVCGPAAATTAYSNRSAITSLAFPSGIRALRERLTGALEERLSGSLEGLLVKAQEELSEVRYQLKVQYNDRVISPEGYMAFLLTNLQSGFEEVARSFGRGQVREMLKRLIQERVLHLAIEHFAGIPEGPSSEAEAAQRLERTVTLLTRSGIGRLASQAMVDAIIESIQRTIMEGPLRHHPAARERLLRHVESTLRRRCRLSTEQVENALKPFKYAIEYQTDDWTRSRAETLALLRAEEARLGELLGGLQERVGGRRLRRAVEYLLREQQQGQGSKVESAAAGEESAIASASNNAFSPMTLELAKEAVQLNHQIGILRKRLTVLSQSSCQLPESTETPSNEYSSLWSWFWGASSTPPPPPSPPPSLSPNDRPKMISHDRCHAACPEIYLNLVADKLVEASALFVHYELVHEFLHPLPDELVSTIRGGGINTVTSASGSSGTDPMVVGNGGNVSGSTVGGDPGTLLGGLGLGREEMVAFVRENASVSRHLDLQERRRALERVCEKLEYLQQRKREQQQFYEQQHQTQYYNRYQQQQQHHRSYPQRHH